MTRPGMGNVRAFTEPFSQTELPSVAKHRSVDVQYHYRKEVTKEGGNSLLQEDRDLAKTQARSELDLFSKY